MGRQNVQSIAIEAEDHGANLLSHQKNCNTK
jgi:hypothetical protein